MFFFVPSLSIKGLRQNCIIILILYFMFERIHVSKRNISGSHFLLIRVLVKTWLKKNLYSGSVLRLTNILFTIIRLYWWCTLAFYLNHFKISQKLFSVVKMGELFIISQFFLKNMCKWSDEHREGLHFFYSHNATGFSNIIKRLGLIVFYCWMLI